MRWSKNAVARRNSQRASRRVAACQFFECNGLYGRGCCEAMGKNFTTVARFLAIVATLSPVVFLPLSTHSGNWIFRKAVVIHRGIERYMALLRDVFNGYGVAIVSAIISFSLAKTASKFERSKSLAKSASFSTKFENTALE